MLLVGNIGTSVYLYMVISNQVLIPFNNETHEKDEMKKFNLYNDTIL